MNASIRFKLHFLITLFTILPLGAKAQDGGQKTWLGAALNYKFANSWEAEASFQHRSEGLIETLDSYFGEFTLNHEVFLDFKLKGGLRYIQNNDTQGKVQGIEDHLRFFMDLNYKHKLDRLEFKYRLRLQTEKELGLANASRENLWRIRSGALLKIKNWSLDPELSIEVFHHLPTSNAIGVHRWRYRIETDFSVAAGKLTLAYFIDRENRLNTSAFNTHIIGMFYSFDL